MIETFQWKDPLPPCCPSNIALSDGQSLYVGISLVRPLFLCPVIIHPGCKGHNIFSLLPTRTNIRRVSLPGNKHECSNLEFRHSRTSGWCGISWRESWQFRWVKWCLKLETHHFHFFFLRWCSFLDGWFFITLLMLVCWRVHFNIWVTRKWKDKPLNKLIFDDVLGNFSILHFQHGFFHISTIFLHTYVSLRFCSTSSTVVRLSSWSFLKKL